MIKRTVFEQYLNNYKQEHKIQLFESVQNAKAAEYDIFLSHSSRDENYALFVRRVLIDLGFTVYMDLFDPKLGPRTPDSITGERLSDILSISKCVFYIHSQNSDVSAWCPWELGFGDGSNKRVVVLEINDDDDYKQEFLAIYPFIKYLPIKGTKDYRFWVYDRYNDEKYIILDKYVLENKETFIHDK